MKTVFTIWVALITTTVWTAGSENESKISLWNGSVRHLPAAAPDSLERTR